MTYTRGFTLIELLVVIAIIGILASVVLGSLQIAREKGKDSGVKADIATVATQAAVYEDTNHGYGGTGANDCTVGVFSDPTVQSSLVGITADNGGGVEACYANDETYVVAAARPAANGYTPDTPYWCADSTGRKCGITDIAAIASGSCGC